MKKNLLAAAAFFLFACNNSNKEDALHSSPNNFSTEGKKVVIYTTADSTNYRLTATDTLSFTELGQSKESQPCIFVDPLHTFQTFIGIGGALTDAAAETFAKLPADKQSSLLRAYYDTVNGIGYTLARTNMNSCDFSSDMYTYVKDND